MRFISVVENALGIKAELQMELMQAGDVVEIFADISHNSAAFSLRAEDNIDEGVRFTICEVVQTFHANVMPRQRSNSAFAHPK